MATAADIRASDPTLPRRGQLSAAIIDAWDLAHPEDPYQAPPSARGDSEPDYSDGDLDSLFDESAAGAEEVPEETRPRKPRATSTRKGGGRGRLGFLGKPGKGGKRAPRVSTADMLGGVWRAAAKLATPLPPLYRTLRIQAPIAGDILEDAVKDTMIDPILQPVARLAGVGKSVSALVGPPAFVTAIQVHCAQAAAQNQQPNPLFMAVATEGLRSCLMAWCQVSGDKFVKAMEREKEFEDRFGKDVDRMMDFLFAPPAEDEDAIQAEEEAIRRAQGYLDD